MKGINWKEVSFERVPIINELVESFEIIARRSNTVYLEIQNLKQKPSSIEIRNINVIPAGFDITGVINRNFSSITFTYNNDDDDGLMIIDEASTSNNTLTDEPHNKNSRVTFSISEIDKTRTDGGRRTSNGGVNGAALVRNVRGSAKARGSRRTRGIAPTRGSIASRDSRTKNSSTRGIGKSIKRRNPSSTLKENEIVTVNSPPRKDL